MYVVNAFRTTRRRFKTDKITLSWSSFSRIWMKPKCNLPPKWSARRRSLSWRPRYAEHTSHTRSFCCWKLDAGIEFLYSSWRETRKKNKANVSCNPPGKVLQRTALMLSGIIKSTLNTKEVPCKTLWAQLTWHSIPADNWTLTRYFRRRAATCPVISLHQVRVSTKLPFTSHTTLPTACWHIADIQRGGAGEIGKEVGTTQVSVTDSA